MPDELILGCDCGSFSCKTKLSFDQREVDVTVAVMNGSEVSDVQLSPRSVARLRDALTKFLKTRPESEWNENQTWPEVCDGCRGLGNVLILTKVGGVRKAALCGKCGGTGRSS